MTVWISNSGEIRGAVADFAGFSLPVSESSVCSTDFTTNPCGFFHYSEDYRDAGKVFFPSSVLPRQVMLWPATSLEVGSISHSEDFLAMMHD
jgi:hypothetical protein